jgi:hypothetical protein
MFETPIVNLNTFCDSCVKIACFSSELIFPFLYAGSSMQNASEQFVSCVCVENLSFKYYIKIKIKLRIIPVFVYCYS